VRLCGALDGLRRKRGLSCLAERLDRRTFLQKLQAGGDYFFSRLETTKNGIGVADGFAYGHGDLVCYVSVPFRRCDVDEGLAADEADGKDRDCGRRCGAPGDAGLDQLLIAKDVRGARDACLGEDALQAVVDLRGDEVDLGLDEDLACGVEDLYRKSVADAPGAFGWDVDVRFEIGVLVYGGEQGGGGDVVAEVNGDVADDTVEGGA
jgi:hypothetical protein